MKGQPRQWTLIACALVAGLCALAGAWLLAAAAVAPARVVTVDGVPMLEVLPPEREVPGGLAGGVVVVHGFAGSADLMRGFADTLARHGYAVVLPDLSGHGANTAPLPADVTGIDRDVDAAVGRLETAYGLRPDHIALVGHSMGASAVTRYGVRHPDLAATVAISLGSAADLPDGARPPANLLVLAGGLEFPAFRATALDALRRADPRAALGTTVGDPRAGTGRRAVIVAGTEHISVLFADQTHTEILRWIDDAVPGGERGAVESHATDRLRGAGVLALGFLIGFVPLAAWLVPRPASAPPYPVGVEPAPPRARRPHAHLVAAAATAAGLVLAAAIAQYLPTTALPIAVGGYTAGFFVVAGLAMVAGWCWGARPATVIRPVRPRLVFAAAVLVAYAALAISLPMQLGFTHAVPVGPRWWLLPVLVAATAVLLLGTELAWGHRWWARATALAATAGTLLVAAMLGVAPGFVLLVLPLLVLLFAWHVGWSAVLTRTGAPRVLSSVVGAVVVAWPIAVTLPLV